MSWLPVYLPFENPMVYRKFEQIQNSFFLNESELQYCLLQSVADHIQHPVGRRVINSGHSIGIWLGVKRPAMIFLSEAELGQQKWMGGCQLMPT